MSDFEFPKEGVVYYFDNKRFAAGRLRRKIKKVDEEMERTRQALDAVQAADEALGRMEAILRRMQSLAEQSARPDCPNREALEGQYQLLKQELDRISAGL